MREGRTTTRTGRRGWSSPSVTPPSGSPPTRKEWTRELATPTKHVAKVAMFPEDCFSVVG